MPSYKFRAKDDAGAQMSGRAIRAVSPERTNTPEPKKKTNIKGKKKKK